MARTFREQKQMFYFLYFFGSDPFCVSIQFLHSGAGLLAGRWVDDVFFLSFGRKKEMSVEGCGRWAWLDMTWHDLTPGKVCQTATPRPSMPGAAGRSREIRKEKGDLQLAFSSNKATPPIWCRYWRLDEVEFEDLRVILRHSAKDLAFLSFRFVRLVTSIASCLPDAFLFAYYQRTCLREWFSCECDWSIWFPEAFRLPIVGH